MAYYIICAMTWPWLTQNRDVNFYVGLICIILEIHPGLMVADVWRRLSCTSVIRHPNDGGSRVNNTLADRAAWCHGRHAMRRREKGGRNSQGLSFVLHFPWTPCTFSRQVTIDFSTQRCGRPSCCGRVTVRDSCCSGSSNAFNSCHTVSSRLLYVRESGRLDDSSDDEAGSNASPLRMGNAAYARRKHALASDSEGDVGEHGTGPIPMSKESSPARPRQAHKAAPQSGAAQRRVGQQ